MRERRAQPFWSHGVGATLVVAVFVGIISWTSKRLVESYRAEGVTEAQKVSIEQQTQDLRNRLAAVERRLQDCGRD